MPLSAAPDAHTASDPDADSSSPESAAVAPAFVSFSDDAVPPTALRRSAESVVPAERSSWFWWGAAAVALVAFVWLHFEVSRSATAPRTPWDEIHPLQIARLLAGASEITPLSGSGYYPGWAILLTPIWWFTQDATTAYHAALALGSMCAAATIIPLTAIGRYMRLTMPQALTVATIVMCLPGRIGAAEYALSEQALMLFYACAVLGMFAIWRRPSWWRLLLFVAAVSAAYLTHTRALALVLTALVWMAFFFRRSIAKAIVGVVLLVLAWRGVDMLATAINSRALIPGADKADLALSALTNVEPNLLARVLFLQSWVQVVGTAGLFALGTVVIVVWMLREVRVLRLGPGSFLFGLTIVTIAMSAIWWTRPDILWRDSYVRLDAWMYSRYIDQVAVFLCLIAIVVLMRRVRASMIWIALGVFVAGAIVVVVRVAPDVPLWGVISTSSSAINSWQELFPDESFVRPLLPSFTNEGSFWLWASLFGVVCIAAMFVLRKFPRLTVALLIVLATVLSLTANLDLRRPAPLNTEATLELADAAAGDGEMLPVDVDLSCTSGLLPPQMLNWAGFWFAPREVNVASPTRGYPFTTDLLLSCHNNAELRESGALRLNGESEFGYRVWVRPGDLQDELSDAGLLEE
ncbi:hypothetical protein ACWPKO_19495 (plasmid) [Coraliomargarita sp. W4R53]